MDRLDDNEEYALTVEAIGILGFTPQENESMFKITAAILNFCNMKFKQKPRDEQAEVVDPAGMWFVDNAGIVRLILLFDIFHVHFHTEKEIKCFMQCNLISSFH